MQQTMKKDPYKTNNYPPSYSIEIFGRIKVIKAIQVFKKIGTLSVFRVLRHHRPFRLHRVITVFRVIRYKTEKPPHLSMQRLSF